MGKAKKKYRPGRVDPLAGARRVMRMANEGRMLDRVSGERPASAETVGQVMATLHSAIASMASGKTPTPHDWGALADCVQAVDCMIRRGNIPEDEGTPIAVAGMKALVLAADRQREGKPLRFDGEGLKAMRELLDVYQQSLEAFTEREVLQILLETGRMRERAFARIEAGQKP